MHLAKEVHGGSTLLTPGVSQREQCVRGLVLHNAHDNVASGEVQRGPGEGVLCTAAHQRAQLHAEAAAEGVWRPCGLPCSARCFRRPLRHPCIAAGPCSCKQRRSSRCSRRSLRRNAVRYHAQMPVVPMTTHGGRGTSSSLANCCMHGVNVTRVRLRVWNQCSCKAHHAGANADEAAKPALPVVDEQQAKADSLREEGLNKLRSCLTAEGGIRKLESAGLLSSMCSS